MVCAELLFFSFVFFLEFLEDWNFGFLMSWDILNFQFPWKYTILPLSLNSRTVSEIK